MRRTLRLAPLALLIAACDSAPPTSRTSLTRDAETSVSSDSDGFETGDADAREIDSNNEYLDARDIELSDGLSDGLSDTRPEADTVPPPADAGTDTTAPDAGPTHLGTPADPLPITAFPWVVDGDSREAPSDVLDRYTCASADESGPELVYRFDVAARAELVAEVLEEDGVDVDLHLLDTPPPSARTATAPCVTRANTRLTADVEPGTYWLVVDTYVNASGPRSGPYRLAVELTVPDAWQTVELAPGITWKKKVYSDYAGGRQTVNVLELSPSAAARVRPYLERGGGCVRPSTVGRREGAIAALNAGFFDTGPGTCPPLDLVKAEGEVLSYNRLTGAAQRSFGWTADGLGMTAWVDAGEDWPAAFDAVGTYPSLVTDGVVRLEPDKDTSFFDARHPRSAIGLKEDGTVLLVTVDGRTSAGAGMTLNALAQHMKNLGAVDAANLDGGGSTTLWIDQKSINGIVNFPSDNGTHDHWGERPVSDVLLILAD
jgi:hypothetical protein